MTAGHFRTIAGAAAGLLMLATVFAVPSPSWAAPPPNDNRADATVMVPSQSVTGTLVEATLELTADSSFCAGTDASVWYRFTAPASGAIVIQVDAAGDLDATVDLFRQVRSTLTFRDCRSTDAQGLATIDDDGLTPGATYALRIGRRTGSVADSFRLRVLVPTPPPQPPGRRLPDGGVRNSVNRLLNPGDAWRTRLRAGRTMRLSLRSDFCVPLEVYGPGTQSFDGDTERTLRCGGYALFTPTRTGRFYLVVRAGRSRDKQPYRLQVAPARRDDTTPGVFIPNHARVSGSVNGGIDFRDLFRFDVTRRSALTLSLSGDPTMTLVRDDGGVLARSDRIDRVVAAGRYYVAVEGSGSYVLKRDSRTITRATLTFNGRKRATIRPGSTASLTLRVRPAVRGASIITIERLDPIEGWQFLSERRPRVAGGRATVRFHPPSVGRYRAFGEFVGTRNAAPDATGVARLRVERRLAD
ncbi:exported hypothetical protein [metagenome]|uniref:Peptidase C-terminal archaeal/bacterial domain-containing protein n=1 Tax=metagenome TaxID=256318 RepID=A0A2P2BXA4_9ZZZZ